MKLLRLMCVCVCVCVCVFVEFAITNSLTDIRLFHSGPRFHISLKFDTGVMSLILPPVAVSHDSYNKTSLRAVSKPVWHIPLLCVQWKIPDDGQRNCPKHIEFYSKNTFWEVRASSWFYYKNLSRCTVTWTSGFSWSWTGTPPPLTLLRRTDEIRCIITRKTLAFVYG